MGPAAPDGQADQRNESTHRTRAGLVIGTTLLAVASFVGAVLLGRELFATGVHREWNILFDADPLVYLKNFATGQTIGDWGGRSFVHPNLTNFVHLPLRALSEVLAWLPLGLGPAAELREHLAFFVCPLAAAVRVSVLVLLLRALGLSTRWTLTLAALDTASFSTRLFASTPESYMLTGTLLAWVFWMGVRTARATALPNLWTWLLALFLLCGTSMLNLVPGAMVFLAACWRHFPIGRRIGVTMALVAAAFALNAGLYQVARIVYPSAPAFHPSATEHVEDSWNPGPTHLADYWIALANAYLPPAPTVRKEFEPGNRRDYVFTFERSGSLRDLLNARPLAFLALLALGVASYWWLPRTVRGPHLTALAILLFGAAFHTVFGRELVLYTQHWKVAVIVVVAGLFYLPKEPRVVLDWGLPLIVIAMTVSNTLLLRGMLITLSGS